MEPVETSRLNDTPAWAGMTTEGLQRLYNTLRSPEDLAAANERIRQRVQTELAEYAVLKELVLALARRVRVEGYDAMKPPDYKAIRGLVEALGEDVSRWPS